MEAIQSTVLPTPYVPFVVAEFVVIVSRSLSLDERCRTRYKPMRLVRGLLTPDWGNDRLETAASWQGPGG